MKRAHMQLVREHSAQSSQLAVPLWTDLGLESGSSVRDLISTWEKQTNFTRGQSHHLLLQPNKLGYRQLSLLYAIILSQAHAERGRGGEREREREQ